MFIDYICEADCQKMPYSKYKPSLLLKPFVDFYYIWEKDEILETPLSISSTANNYCVMLFNYGDKYCLYNRLYKGEALPKNFLSGLSTSPFRLQLFGKVNMMGIVFKGTAFQDLFHIPAPVDFLDERIDLETIIGYNATVINDQLAEALDDLERLTIIENFLFDRIKHANLKTHPIDQAVDMIMTRKGMIKVDNVAEKMNLSSRQFRRCFTKRVGIGPKYFARIKRFNFVNLCLSKNPELKWMEFVSDGGYFDQSHFIKDYLEFSGKSPIRFLQRNTGYLQEIINNNKRATVHTKT